MKYLYHDIWWFISDRFHRNLGQGETKNIKEKVELPWHKRMRGAGVRVDKVTCGFRQQSLCKKPQFTFTFHHRSIWELMTLKANLVFNFPETTPSCCYELTARALSLKNEYLMMQSTSEFAGRAIPIAETKHKQAHTWHAWCDSQHLGGSRKLLKELQG